VPTLPTSQCNNEYEYIVAVVAANKDSSVLLNLQSFQAQSGYFFGVSALAFMILALTMMFWWWCRYATSFKVFYRVIMFKNNI
jgi:hypothetical protein